jgi:hypothetical protein
MLARLFTFGLYSASKGVSCYLNFAVCAVLAFFSFHNANGRSNPASTKCFNQRRTSFTNTLTFCLVKISANSSTEYGLDLNFLLKIIKVSVKA